MLDVNIYTTRKGIFFFFEYLQSNLKNVENIFWTYVNNKYLNSIQIGTSLNNYYFLCIIIQIIWVLVDGGVGKKSFRFYIWFFKGFSGVTSSG